MNERIRELAEQAHSYACKYAQQPDYNPHNPYNQGMYKQRYDSKFAELIVRECMNIVSNQTTLDTNEDFREGFNHGLKYAWTDIRKHFGVE
jgi:hypothetical protein